MSLFCPLSVHIPTGGSSKKSTNISVSAHTKRSSLDLACRYQPQLPTLRAGQDKKALPIRTRRGPTQPETVCKAELKAAQPSLLGLHPASRSRSGNEIFSRESPHGARTSRTERQGVREANRLLTNAVRESPPRIFRRNLRVPPKPLTFCMVIKTEFPLRFHCNVIVSCLLNTI